MSSPLRIIREKMKITQSELAELMGTTQATVSRMEAGKWEPSASQIQAVLKKSNEERLNLSFDDFVFSIDLNCKFYLATRNILRITFFFWYIQPIVHLLCQRITVYYARSNDSISLWLNPQLVR